MAAKTQPSPFAKLANSIGTLIFAGLDNVADFFSKMRPAFSWIAKQWDDFWVWLFDEDKPVVPVLAQHDPLFSVVGADVSSGTASPSDSLFDFNELPTTNTKSKDGKSTPTWLNTLRHAFTKKVAQPPPPPPNAAQLFIRNLGKERFHHTRQFEIPSGKYTVMSTNGAQLNCAIHSIFGKNNNGLVSYEQHQHMRNLLVEFILAAGLSHDFTVDHEKVKTDMQNKGSDSMDLITRQMHIMKEDVTDSLTATSERKEFDYAIYFPVGTEIQVARESRIKTYVKPLQYAHAYRGVRRGFSRCPQDLSYRELSVLAWMTGRTIRCWTRKEFSSAITLLEENIFNPSVAYIQQAVIERANQANANPHTKRMAEIIQEIRANHLTNMPSDPATPIELHNAGNFHFSRLAILDKAYVPPLNNEETLCLDENGAAYQRMLDGYKLQLRIEFQAFRENFCFTDEHLDLIAEEMAQNLKALQVAAKASREPLEHCAIQAAERTILKKYSEKPEFSFLRMHYYAPQILACLPETYAARITADKAKYDAEVLALKTEIDPKKRKELREHKDIMSIVKDNDSVLERFGREKNNFVYDAPTPEILALLGVPASVPAEEPARTSPVTSLFDGIRSASRTSSSKIEPGDTCNVDTVSKASSELSF